MWGFSPLPLGKRSDGTTDEAVGLHVTDIRCYDPTPDRWLAGDPVAYVAKGGAVFPYSGAVSHASGTKPD
jgi:hypothetical protein